MRLSANPRLSAALSKLPPKLLLVSSEATQVADVSEEELATRVTSVGNRIRSAKFIGKGDADAVPKMYEEYVSRIADMMMPLLAMASTDAAAEQNVRMPAVAAVPAAPLRLDGDQLLLLRDGTGRDSSGAGDTHLATVAGDHVVRVLGDGEHVELSFDGCSQAVLPWKSPKVGWDATLRRDVETISNLAGGLRIAIAVAERISPHSATEAEMKSMSEAAISAMEAMRQRPQSLALLSAAENAIPRIVEQGVAAAVAASAVPAARADIAKTEDGLAGAEAAFAQAKFARDEADEAKKAAQADLHKHQRTAEPDTEAANLKAKASLAQAKFALAHADEAKNAAQADLNEHRRTVEKAKATLKGHITKIADLQTSCLEELRALVPENAVAGLVKVLLASKAVGARRYAAGQLLTVRIDGVWQDAVVEAAESGVGHRVRLDSSSAAHLLPLHPWNHAPRDLPQADMASVHAWYIETQRDQHTRITDAISGQKLDTLQQCVAISIPGRDLGLIKDAHSLAAWLRAQHESRVQGSVCEQPCAVLLTAGPAAGKTTLLSQTMALSLEGELVPILIKVQRLQRRLLDTPDAFAASWNWLDAYLRLEHEPTAYRFLRQAMMARRALLLLDGLDEGGAMRAEIERHVTEVLAPQGHVLLCTSRPAGVDEARFVAFRKLHLSPLTEAQQEEALLQRLGASRAALLLDYVRKQVLRDENGVRVTANPLMLSMFASVFEMRQGINMPSKVAELYGTASDAMLGRGGVASGEVRRLLQRVFFAAHVAQRREIESWQLDEAALGLELPEVLAAIRKREIEAPFPIFEGRAEKGHYVEVVEGEHLGKRGVISEDDRSSRPYIVIFADGNESNYLYPRQLKSSGFDEAKYYVRATAASANEMSDACTQLPAEMRGALEEIRHRIKRDELPLLSLLQAQPLRLQSSHLSFQEYFAARTLCEEGTVLSGVSPWQWPVWWANVVTIGAEMGDAFGHGLLRSAGVRGDTLDLRGKLRGDLPTVLRVIVEMLQTNALTECNLLNNGLLDTESATILAKLGTERGIMLSGIKRDQQEADFRELGLKPADAILIASDLTVTHTLTSIDLHGNELGAEGGKALAGALAGNTTLTKIYLEYNDMGNDAKKALREASRSRKGLELEM